MKERMHLGDLGDYIISFRLLMFIWSGFFQAIGSFAVFAVLPSLLAYQHINSGIILTSSPFWDVIIIAPIFYFLFHLLLGMIILIEFPAEVIIQCLFMKNKC